MFFHCNFLFHRFLLSLLNRCLKTCRVVLHREDLIENLIEPTQFSKYYFGILYLIRLEYVPDAFADIILQIIQINLYEIAGYRCEYKIGNATFKNE